MVQPPVRDARARSSTSPDGPESHRPLTDTDWLKIEQDSEFQSLVKAKRAFIVPATIFFIVYYFSLPILVGYAPAFMDTKIIGYINLAYLFAVSQFIMAWILMAMYVKRAGLFDALAGRIVDKVRGGRL